MDDDRIRHVEDAWLEAALDEEFTSREPGELSLESGAPVQRVRAWAAALWILFGLAVVVGVATVPLVGDAVSEAVQESVQDPVKVPTPVEESQGAVAEESGEESAEPVQPPLRVLYLAALPTWNYRYLKNHLKRFPERYQMAGWLDDASRSFEQEHSPGRAPLTESPILSGDFTDYDLILVDELEVARWGPDDAVRHLFAERLARFVAEGGGLYVRCDDRLRLEQIAEFAELRDLLPLLPNDEPPQLVPAGSVSLPRGPYPLVPDPVQARVDTWAVGEAGVIHVFNADPVDGAEVVLRAGQFAEPVVARRTVGRGRVVVSRLDAWRLRQGAGGKTSDAEGERLHAMHYDRLFAWLSAGRRTSGR